MRRSKLSRLTRELFAASFAAQVALELPVFAYLTDPIYPAKLALRRMMKNVRRMLDGQRRLPFHDYTLLEVRT